MSGPDNNGEELERIRKKAEALVREKGVDLPQMPDQDISRLVFELQTHQIELEMQNDELVRTQHELEESRDRYSDLFDFAPVGYATTTVKGLILESNLTLCNFLGVEKPDLKDTPLSSFVFPEDQDILFRHLRNISGTTVRNTCCLRLLHADEQFFWAEMDTLYIPGTHSGEAQLRTVINDITERKCAEEEKEALEAQLHHSQKLESLGVLAGGMAHNFNNLLAPILGYAELVLSTTDPSSLEANQLEVIIKSAKKAKSLVDKILVFGQKGVLNTQPLQLEESVEDALVLIKPSLPGHLKIHKDFEPNLPAIAADPGQLHQVVLNLLINAMQAITGKGEIRIKLENISNYEFVSAHGEYEIGDYLLLEIADSGSGIAPADLDMIFDPFFSTKELGGEGGFGLGLTTVARIVEHHHGKIEVQSNLGVGTTFQVFLPAIESAVRPPVAEDPPLSKSKGEKVLYVEDEPMVNAMGVAFLEKLGFEVSSFMNPQKAISHFETDPYSYRLVLTDYSMPRLNGAQLAMRVKSIRADIPIILSTGYSNMATEENLKKWSCSGVIVKPYTFQELQNCLRDLVLED